MIPVMRRAAAIVKIMALLLWHAIRYPNAASVIDVQTRTVRLVGGLP